MCPLLRIFLYSFRFQVSGDSKSIHGSGTLETGNKKLETASLQTLTRAGRPARVTFPSGAKARILHMLSCGMAQAMPSRASLQSQLCTTICKPFPPQQLEADPFGEHKRLTANDCFSRSGSRLRE